MAMTGHRHLDGTPQLEQDERKTFWCKLRLHRMVIEDFNPTTQPSVYMKRCVHCNHMKPTKVVNFLGMSIRF